MTLSTKYFQSLIDYSDAIMVKSIEESDLAVKTISGVIEILLNDSSRISKMSSDTIAAMKTIESSLNTSNSQTSPMKVTKLISALRGIVQDHRTSNEILMPIIEALQFQDLIRQQMENLGKVMRAWFEARKEFGVAPTEAQVLEFGKKILSMTSMQKERDIIRGHISGLPNETKVDDVILF